MDELLARHRKEARDLQARITQKKKQATKKTRKGINAECDRLEQDLAARQADEVRALEHPDGEPTVDSPSEDEEPSAAAADPPPETASPTPAIDDSNSSTPTTTTTTSERAPKRNRQQERLARRAAEREALSAAAEAEASSQPDLRARELATMEALIASHNLREHPIAPDGHCLYSAFSDQVGGGGYREARIRCADELRARRGEYEAFIDIEGEGGDGSFEEHVRKVGETAEWGGQVEVLALGRAFGVKVNVLQAEGRSVEKLNEDATGEEVWLAYYRHSFGLGEHYNSLRKKDEKEVADGKTDGKVEAKTGEAEGGGEKS